MHNPAYNRTEAMEKHRELLIKKRKHLDGLIELIERRIKWDDSISFKEFDATEIKRCREQYADEVKERWGATDAYAQSKKKTHRYSKEDWKSISDTEQGIFNEFAALRGGDPAGKEAADLVRRWQQHISDNYYTCTNEILAGLGEMYVGDQRFTQSIDKSGEGTAEFMSMAIAAYCK